MLMIKNNETLLLLLCISYTSVKKVRLFKGKILILPRLSGQMANTMMSVGNEQRRSKGKFVLQEKALLSQLFISRPSMLLQQYHYFRWRCLFVCLFVFQYFAIIVWHILSHEVTNKHTERKTFANVGKFQFMQPRNISTSTNVNLNFT